LLSASLFILGCVSTACNASEPSITIEQSDDVSIYSTVIRQIYDRIYQCNAVYIIRYTDDTNFDPRTKPSEPILLSETMQSEITIMLQDLPAEIVWVNSSDEVEKGSYGEVLDRGVIITIGNIQPQDNGTVQIYASQFMAPLCAEGDTYVLEFIEGIWKITGNTMLWIS
jgi:hypothetical protein